MPEQEHYVQLLTDRFTRAVEYAREIHAGYRKGTEVPYMAHLCPRRCVRRIPPVS